VLIRLCTFQRGFLSNTSQQQTWKHLRKNKWLFEQWRI